jgi:hypothetical protein
MLRGRLIDDPWRQRTMQFLHGPGKNCMVALPKVSKQLFPNHGITRAKGNPDTEV